MSTHNEYKCAIREILEDVNPYEEFDDDTDLIECGFLDSLTIVYLVTQLEETYHIEIDEKLVVPNNFTNLNMISNLLKTLETK